MSVIKIKEISKDRVRNILKNEENFRKDTAVFDQMIALYQSLVDSLSLLNSHIAIDSDDFKDSINEQTKKNIKSLIALDLRASNA